MAVGIAAYADHAVIGAGCPEKCGGAGACAAMMRNLQHIAAQICAGAEKLAFDGGTDITGEQEAEAAVLNHYDDR